MKKQSRDFHRQVRVVYRAVRRLYGKERTQDECLKVFKVVFPELHRARQSEKEYWQFPDDAYDKLVAIFRRWMPEEGALHDLLCYVGDQLDRVMLREEFVQFCEDIMPVVMRIRKLTPRECFRLMGVGEAEIDVLLGSGISNSSCYKLAGNSIVCGGNRRDSQGNVDGVLYNIFRTMFVETSPQLKEGDWISMF